MKSHITFKMVTFNLTLRDLERSNSRSWIFQQPIFHYWMELGLRVLLNTYRKAYMTFTMVFNLTLHALERSNSRSWMFQAYNLCVQYINFIWEKMPVSYRAIGTIFYQNWQFWSDFSTLNNINTLKNDGKKIDSISSKILFYFWFHFDCVLEYHFYDF